MAWTVARIEKEILGASFDTLALSPESAVAAIERVERMLGIRWIESSCQARGILPALHILSTGLRLSALEGVPRSERLLNKLRKIGDRDQNAGAELTAIFILRSRDPSAEVELEPGAVVGKADFRVRKDEGQWMTVEVTRPGQSREEKQVRSIVATLANNLAAVEGRFALDVVLRSVPTKEDLMILCEGLPEFCRQSGTHSAELVGQRGYLFLNHSDVTALAAPSIPELENRPMVGLVVFTGGPDGRPRNHVSVRLPFTDERGEGILRKEAKQLSKDGPGLIMINVANNPGNFDAWASFIAPRFRRDIHTRVSAVCFFSEGIGDAGKGYSYFIEGRLLLNDHARYSLPPWIGGDSRITFVTAISPRSVGRHD